MRVLVILALLILVLSSFNVLAIHDSLPNQPWTNQDWDGWKEQNLCNCFSGIDAILKRRNPKLDSLPVAESCVNFCTHCEATPKDSHKSQAEECLGSGFLKEAPDLINCLGAKAKTFCKNDLGIVYKEPVYEAPKIVWHTGLPPPQKKETPTPKPSFSESDCKIIAQNLLYKIGMDEYCKNTFTLPIFANALKNDFTSLGRSREEFNQCSESLWSNAYNIAKKLCPVATPSPTPKKEEAKLPLLPPKNEVVKKPFPWLTILLIISGLLIVAGAVAGIMHVHKRHHEIKAMEQARIESKPEEVHEVKEAIKEVQEKVPLPPPKKKAVPKPQELRQGISIPPPVPVPPTYEGKTKKTARKTRPLPPEDVERFKFEK